METELEIESEDYRDERTSAPSFCSTLTVPFNSYEYQARILRHLDLGTTLNSGRKSAMYQSKRQAFSEVVVVVVVVVVVIVFTLNRPFYPASSVHPVSVLKCPSKMMPF